MNIKWFTEKLYLYWYLLLKRLITKNKGKCVKLLKIRNLHLDYNTNKKKKLLLKYTKKKLKQYFSGIVCKNNNFLSDNQVPYKYFNDFFLYAYFYLFILFVIFGE